MRQILYGLAAAIVICPAPALAQQQGSIQLSGSVQGVTGDPIRTAGQHAIEPDFGVSWQQPGTRFGLFSLELRGTRRGDLPHLGKGYVAFRDMKYRGMSWTAEAGDVYISPGIGEYKFSNLFAPAVTFTGVAVSARSKESSLVAVAGKTSAWRNIFGSDADTLGQTLFFGRGAHKLNDRVEVLARASRVRTRNLREFTFSIAESTQAGGGVRVTATSAVQLAADASFVQYRRDGSDEVHRDGSIMLGTNVLLARGWVQINASRFSPGEFPVLNYPLQDREGVFAAAEYDVWPRVRLQGGYDAFRSNLDLDGSSASTRPLPRSTGARAFAAVRFQVSSRSSVMFRIEDGDRMTRPIRGGLESESDTGTLIGEWQAMLGRTTLFTRYSRREDVNRTSLDAAFTQHDASSQFFANASRSVQFFGLATLTHTEMDAGGGSTYWQAGGGAQIQLPRRNLWFRAEGTASRNVDLLTRNFVPRESIGVGLNGQVTGNMTVGFNLYADRIPSLTDGGAPWSTRSTLRVTQRFATGAARISGNGSPITAAAARGRGRGSVVGHIFADWNANGIADAGEGPLEGIPVRLRELSSVTTARDGQFAFLNVPGGLAVVGLDTAALPIDFDPPSATEIEVEVSSGDTRRVAFGLIPLGTIRGRVLRDANANGQVDASDEPVDQAVLILDKGARSEQVLKGRFRFEAVRAGEHHVTLLPESMPEGAVIIGPSEHQVTLERDRLDLDVTFLVKFEKRPEIRKVFPPRGGGSAARAPAQAPAPAPARAPAPRAPSAPPALSAPSAPSAPSAGFAIQLGAFVERMKAEALVKELKTAGVAAFIVDPAPGDRDQFFRVRVGGFKTRAAAQQAAKKLEKLRGEKLWVITARSTRT